MNPYSAVLRTVFLFSSFSAVLMLLANSQRRQEFEENAWLYVGVSVMLSLAVLAALVVGGQLRVKQRVRPATFALVYARALATTFIKLFVLVGVSLGAVIAVAVSSPKDGAALGLLLGFWFAASLSPAVAAVVVARSLDGANDA
jgi:hypothetical protein